MLNFAQRAIVQTLRPRLEGRRYHDQLQVKAGELAGLLAALDDETLRADTETRRHQLLTQLIDATQPQAQPPAPQCKATAPTCRS